MRVDLPIYSVVSKYKNTISLCGGEGCNPSPLFFIKNYKKLIFIINNLNKGNQGNEMDKKNTNRVGQQNQRISVTSIHESITQRLETMENSKRIVPDDNYNEKYEEAAHRHYLRLFFLKGYSFWSMVYDTKDGY